MSEETVDLQNLSQEEITYQYNQHSTAYENLTISDPNKRYVQYPETLRILGGREGLEGTTLLDIGCANGELTRMIARLGADVTAYDPSPEQVKLAQDTEKVEPLGIKYVVADRPDTASKESFDHATAIMVLTLAKDIEQLKEMFQYAHDSLKSEGSFVALTFNPNFKRYGKKVYNRVFMEPVDGRMTIEFYDNQGTKTFDIICNYYSTEDYEESARQAGFNSVKWESLKVDPKGRADLGEEFWEGFESDPPYMG
ncbi:MAG: class I SAM-dependent methyltransferase, partial [Candidatus Berkelbacteria bacterium]|nr:class I SAM-dependent methyltransferase [Candidatus Berkelbacteria bacterium]